MSCADENGHKFGERTELIKKLSGKLQNYQKLYSIIAGPPITKIYLNKCELAF